MSPLFAQAQQAWKQTIEQLRYTLNRADFDAWVRDARPLRYDGQVLTVGVANAYARDWLTDRLRATLENTLRGLLNAPVQVVFVVTSPKAVATAAPDSPENAFPDNGTIVPQAAAPDPAPAASPDDAPKAHAQPPPNLDLQAVSARLRDALQQTHRVIFIPGYFLRWLPRLGTRAGWLYVALRQTYFLANLQPHGPGQRIPPGQALEVSRATLAHWSHLTPRTINNILNQNLLQPLVKVERDRHLNAHRQAPNRYIFTHDLPLTPADLARALAYLTRRGLEDDPIAALAQALQQPPQALLTSPDEVEGDALVTAPLTGSLSLRDQIARRLRPRHLPQETLAKALGMAELLETSLVESEGKLFIPWYFIEHHLPRLGHTLAWLYVVALHRAAREGRAAARGFRTLQTTSRQVAAWLGLKKARYGRDLIPPLPLEADTAADDPAAFVRRLPGRGSTFTLAVQSLLPLTAADAAAYDLALRALAACVQRDDFAPLHALVAAPAPPSPETLAALQTLANAPDASAANLQRAWEALQQVSTVLPEISSGLLENTPEKRQFFPSEAPKPSRGNAKTFPRERQNLPAEPAKNFPHVNFNNPQATSEKTLEQPSPRAGGGATWQWQQLTTNQLAPETLKTLRQRPAWHWVSWLLYATAHTEQIANPLGFAVHKTRQGHSAGGVYDILAQVSPERLQAWVARHLDYGPESVLAEEPLWREFAQTPRAAMLALASWLAAVDFV